ncbi:hypothetical protein GQ457_01G009990 [Hibiscus cannabinus]
MEFSMAILPETIFEVQCGRFWIYAGSKVYSFDEKKVCLSSMKKDLPWIKAISCLKYGSWMIRPAPLIEAGACHLLELSPRSCIKFKTYSFRSVFGCLFCAFGNCSIPVPS